MLGGEVFSASHFYSNIDWDRIVSAVVFCELLDSDGVVLGRVELLGLLWGE